MTLPEREAHRARYAQAAKMRAKMPAKAVAAFLELSVSRVYDLLAYPPPSEEQLDLQGMAESEYAEFRDFCMAERREEERQWREALRQHQRDEVHEVKAQAVACLAEALAEMRPYVGTEP